MGGVGSFFSSTTTIAAVSIGLTAFLGFQELAAVGLLDRVVGKLPLPLLVVGKAGYTGLKTAEPIFVACCLLPPKKPSMPVIMG